MILLKAAAGTGIWMDQRASGERWAGHDAQQAGSDPIAVNQVLDTPVFEMEGRWEYEKNGYPCKSIQAVDG
jgi:hypothetical protein